MAEDNTPTFQIQRIYLKESSLEQPNSPAILLEKEQPAVDIQLGVEANTAADGVYEICVTATVHTKLKERTVFLVEVKQAGIFEIRNIPEDQMGAIMGNAGKSNQFHLYEFGRNLGIAFQIQDDYLDAFGDPAKFGKQVGGDIAANKKTFLAIRALETGTPAQVAEFRRLMELPAQERVPGTLSLFRECGVDRWAYDLKEQYIAAAYTHLEDIAVQSFRKAPLKELARFLVQRDH